MNNVVFSTGGEWESTTLHNNGVELMASKLYVELHAGRDEWGEPLRGGIECGGEMAAYIRLQQGDEEAGVFPGRLELTFPGHRVVVENRHPRFDFACNRVWYNDREVTRSVMDLVVNIDAAENVVEAYLTLYRPHLIGADEAATHNLI